MKKPIFKTKEEKRMAAAILLVLYEVYPMPLQRDEILIIITERGLLKMPDEEFEKYKENIFHAKRN